MEMVVYLLIVIVMTNRYVLGAFLKRLKGAAYDMRDDSYLPTVAVAIPLFNEGEGIFHTIKSLLQLDYPADRLEIIVVDDCSTDDSYDWAKEAAEGHPNVTVLRNERNMGKRHAINRAVRHTRAEVVVSVDSDVRVDKRALRELVARFTSPEVAAVGGRTYVVNRHDTWLTRMVEIKFYFAQEWLKGLERAFGSVTCLSGCLTAYRREVLLELEPVLDNRNILGVPIRYGEDRFLTRQILKRGYKTLFTTDAFCFTAAPSRLSPYFSQQLRWRRSNLVDYLGGLSHVWRLHPVVALHYLALFALLVAYPLSIVDAVVNDDLWRMVTLHFGLLAALGLFYRAATRHLPEERRVPALSFLPFAVLMPVSYLVFTPLALFTLDSGSWETRGAAHV